VPYLWDVMVKVGNLRFCDCGNGPCNLTHNSRLEQQNSKLLHVNSGEVGRNVMTAVFKLKKKKKKEITG
jgi:hypothetical protein